LARNPSTKIVVVEPGVNVIVPKSIANLFADNPLVLAPPLVEFTDRTIGSARAAAGVMAAAQLTTRATPSALISTSI